MITVQPNKANRNLIVVISIIIPIAVAILLSIPHKFFLGNWVYHLPRFNAFINTATAILLVFALVAIKMKKIKTHQKLMTAGFFLGSLFLITYIIYHLSVPSVRFGDINHDGVLSSVEASEITSTRGLYLFVLISNILLSIGVVPFVLFAFYYSLSGLIDRHKKIVKYTFPLWLYVSLSGVIVYLMINPYYPF